MFEVGFLELALIFVVALVVLGPSKLPGLVRTVGRWIGKARAVARDFQRQLEQEASLEELNKFTERNTPKNTTPAPPPEFSGAPVNNEATPEAPGQPPTDYASSGYPYGAPQPAPGVDAAPEAPAAPQPGDDTYSHAHATGESQPAAPHEPAKPA